MSGYAGKIKNSGTQDVKAVYSGKNATKGTQRITGGDLRIGNAGKKSGK